MRVSCPSASVGCYNNRLKMEEERVDLDLLRNCTLLAVNKFPWATTVNDTAVIGAMNLTNVIDLIADMIDVFRERFLEDDFIK